MACGESCRRLSAGAGITITPDCCGGCVISASGGEAGCTCVLAADPARPGIVITPGGPGSYWLGLDPAQAQNPQVAANAAEIKTLTDRLNAFPPIPPSFLTGPQVQAMIDASVSQALADHAAKCHTLKIVTAGVTTEAGWEVELAELRSIGGVNTVFIRLNRTGGDLVGVDADWTNSEGKHEEGNIVPDLLIAHVPEGWRPPQTYMAFGDNSYGNGGVRVHGNGDVYLCDWMTNNVIQDGYALRFEYEFLAASPCETPAP